MERWTNLSLRLGPDSEFRFTGDFFTWLRHQLIMIEYFPYARVDFHDNMELVLLEGEDWDVSGKKPNNDLVKCF